MKKCNDSSRFEHYTSFPIRFPQRDQSSGSVERWHMKSLPPFFPLSDSSVSFSPCRAGGAFWSLSAVLMVDNHFLSFWRSHSLASCTHLSYKPPVRNGTGCHFRCNERPNTLGRRENQTGLPVKSAAPRFLRSSFSFSPVRPSTVENPGRAGVVGDAGLRLHSPDKLFAAAT